MKNIIAILIMISVFFVFHQTMESGEYDKFSRQDISEHETLGQKIAGYLIRKRVNPYVSVLVIAMLPVVELRGAIPAGIAMGLRWELVILFSIIGNMVPIFFILFFLAPVEKILRNIKLLDRFFVWLYKRTLRKSDSVKKYEQIGLMFFVSIPLPVTGAWTGSLIAYLLKFKYFMSIVYIFLGVCIAGAIVSTITYLAMLGFERYGYIGFTLVIGMAIIVFTALSLIKNRQNNHNMV